MGSSLLVTNISHVTPQFNLIPRIFKLQLRFPLHSSQSSIMPLRVPETFTAKPPPCPYNLPAYIFHWIADTLWLLCWLLRPGWLRHWAAGGQLVLSDHSDCSLAVQRGMQCPDCTHCSDAARTCPRTVAKIFPLCPSFPCKISLIK